MLTPEYLEQLPQPAVQLWQQVEDDILRDVARRIAKAEDMTDTASWQLWRLEQSRALRQDVVKLLAKYSGKSDALIRQLLQEAGYDALLSDDALHTAAGAQLSDMRENTALLALLNAGYRQTAGTWKNLTATTANTVTGQFEQAMDRAWLQVASGAFDYQTAIRRATNDLADTMQYITYPSGHRDTLEVAVRRCILTGVNQTAAKLQLARMEEAGCQYVEVTAHAGARPSHAAWQGKVYKRGREFENATGYGTGAGLCGWNCRHNFYPFYPGISERNYSDRELTALESPVMDYKGKPCTQYDLSQLQRGLERKVRKYKRRYLAEEASGQDATLSAVKLRQARQELKQFVKDTGGRADSIRTHVQGFGRSAAGKATGEANSYYRRWAKGEGIDAPKTLADYYYMKYNNPKEYALLKTYVSQVDRGTVSPLVTFSVYKKLHDEIDRDIVGMTTVNGVKIQSQSLHFMERVVGTLQDPTHNNNKRQGVSIENIKNTLLFGEYELSKPDELGRTAFVYTWKKYIVTVNSETGRLIQCNPCSKNEKKKGK